MLMGGARATTLNTELHVDHLQWSRMPNLLRDDFLCFLLIPCKEVHIYQVFVTEGGVAHGFGVSCMGHVRTSLYTALKLEAEGTHSRTKDVTESCGVLCFLVVQHRIVQGENLVQPRTNLDLAYPFVEEGGRHTRLDFGEGVRLRTIVDAGDSEITRDTLSGRIGLGQLGVQIGLEGGRRETLSVGGVAVEEEEGALVAEFILSVGQHLE